MNLKTSICNYDFQGKTPFVTLRHGWDSIETNLKTNGQMNMDRTVLDQDRDRWWALVRMIMKVRVQQNVGNIF